MTPPPPLDLWFDDADLDGAFLGAKSKRSKGRKNKKSGRGKKGGKSLSCKGKPIPADYEQRCEKDHKWCNKLINDLIKKGCGSLLYQLPVSQESEERSGLESDSNGLTGKQKLILAGIALACLALLLILLVYVCYFKGKRGSGGGSGSVKSNGASGKSNAGGKSAKAVGPSNQPKVVRVSQKKDVLKSKKGKSSKKKSLRSTKSGKK